VQVLQSCLISSQPLMSAMGQTVRCTTGRRGRPSANSRLVARCYGSIAAVWCLAATSRSASMRRYLAPSRQQRGWMTNSEGNKRVCFGSTTITDIKAAHRHLTKGFLLSPSRMRTFESSGQLQFRWLLGDDIVARRASELIALVFAVRDDAERPAPSGISEPHEMPCLEFARTYRELPSFPGVS
jgi:hypothetical protein